MSSSPCQVAVRQAKAQERCQKWPVKSSFNRRTTVVTRVHPSDLIHGRFVTTTFCLTPTPSPSPKGFQHYDVPCKGSCCQAYVSLLGISEAQAPCHFLLSVISKHCLRFSYFGGDVLCLRATAISSTFECLSDSCLLYLSPLCFTRLSLQDVCYSHKLL